MTPGTTAAGPRYTCVGAAGPLRVVFPKATASNLSRRCLTVVCRTTA